MWLTELVKQHEELESPRSFWYWSALAAISAVVKDQVWLNRQIYKLYPNIYVMLHADSGLKKGPPINMAKQLVRVVNNTRIITGRSSIQGILKDLGTAYTSPGGRVQTKSVAFICSSEFSSSIVEDKVATTILTDLYDRQYNEGDWKSLLKMETFSLKDPTITMLTATNEAHSDDFFLKKDIQGGYFARTFIIYENKRQQINSLMYPLEHPPDYKASGEYLKEVAKLNGEFQIEDSARRYYDDWYNDFIHAIDSQQIKDPTGTLNRFGDSVLKVSMLLSLAESPELVIKTTAMEEAIKHCEMLIGNVRKTTLGRGKSQWAQEKAIVIEELLERDNHTISRQQLNKKYWMRANSSEWDEIMLSLEAGGVIKIEASGNQILYKMPDIRVEEWTKHLKGQ
jgi:hypothetical protein